MLHQLIIYTTASLALIYIVANSLVRLVLGRSCQASSWCLTSLLTLVTLVHLGAHLPTAQFYAAETLPYVAAAAIAFPVLISTSLLIARRRRSTQA